VATANETVTDWPNEPSYSTDGPECPKCGFTFTPDESYYYELRYTEDTCQECGCKFSVEVHHSVSWKCEAMPTVGKYVADYSPVTETELTQPTGAEELLAANRAADGKDML
jgi:hypothetical protein